ncbi:DUF1826 domain-containing protein [Methylocystis sp. SC2]|uniref:DUF1826 domain-containing protein n=1 Tax=Methylocystis sp. (strain SC2) TaxID=187303 RepID=UPI0002DADD89|nr:DUF1826 domain-containing protein [Methylocystis sp. SC2]
MLRMIRRSEIDLAIWRRELPAALSSWLDAWPVGEWPNLRDVLTPAEIARTLRRHFDGAGIEHCDGRAMLIDDVTQLATLYAHALRLTHVQLRLEGYFTRTNERVPSTVSEPPASAAPYEGASISAP